MEQYVDNIALGENSANDDLTAFESRGDSDISEYYPPNATVETRSKFVVNKRDMIFSILFLLLSICGVAFGLWGGFHLGFSISFILMFAVMTVYLFGKTSKLKIFHILCGLISVLSASVFAISSQGSVKFWMFILMVFCSGVWFEALGFAREEKGDLGIIGNFFSTAVADTFSNLPRAMAAVFSGGGEKRKGVAKVIAGMALSLPVLCVVIPLLIRSDAAFEGLVSELFKDFGSFILKTILGVSLSGFVIAYAFTRKKDEAKPVKESCFNGIDSVYIISFLSVIAVCYLVYLFSQLAYFFSAFSGFLPEDYKFTLAGYARRGFFEMSIIAGINFALIFGSVLLSRKERNVPPVGIKLLCSFIGLFTLIIIATAISKMALYINKFGMTVLRITTSSFMIFLSVVFIAVILRCFTDKVKVIKIAVVTAGVVLLVLGIGNVNRFVAGYNYNAYKSGVLKEIDVQTIYDMGEEGIPYLVKLAGEKGTVCSDRARALLLEAFKDMYEYDYEYKYDSLGDNNKHRYTFKEHKYIGFEKWSYSRSEAYRYLDEVLKKNPDYGK